MVFLHFLRRRRLVTITLASIECFESRIEHCQQLFVANQSPTLGVVVSWGCLTRKSFHNQIGSQTSQNLNKQVDILLYRPRAEAFGRTVVFVSHCCPTEELQLMEFDGSKWQRIDRIALVYKHLVALFGQSEDKVRTAMQTLLGGHLHRAAGTRKVVATVDPGERRIVARLDALLDRNIFLARQFGQQIELLAIDTIGARADDYALHLRVRKSLGVELAQAFDGSVSI